MTYTLSPLGLAILVRETSFMVLYDRTDRARLACFFGGRPFHHGKLLPYVTVIHRRPV